MNKDTFSWSPRRLPGLAGTKTTFSHSNPYKSTCFAQPLNTVASCAGININRPWTQWAFKKKLVFEASVPENRAVCKRLCPKTGTTLRSLHLAKTLFKVFATLQRACVIRSLRAVAQRRCRGRHFFGATALGSFQEIKKKKWRKKEKNNYLASLLISTLNLNKERVASNTAPDPNCKFRSKWTKKYRGDTVWACTKFILQNWSKCDAAKILVGIIGLFGPNYLCLNVGRQRKCCRFFHTRCRDPSAEGGAKGGYATTQPSVVRQFLWKESYLSY